MLNKLREILNQHNITPSDEILNEINSSLINEFRSENERYKRLTENSPEITYIYSLNKGAIFWSSRVKDILGFNPENLIEDSKKWDNSIHPDDKQYIESIFDHIEVGKIYNLEYRIYDIQNKLHWFYDQIFNVYESNGELILEGLISDITAFKETERKLLEEKEKFDAITSSAQDAIILINHKGEVTFWNNAAEKIFQYKKNEIIGKNLHAVLAPIDLYDNHKKAFAEFIKTGKGNAINQTLELNALRKDGVLFPIELSLAALQIKDQWNAIGIVRDISNRKNREKELKESEERFKLLSGLTFEGIVIHKNGILIDCNESFLKIVNYNRNEVLGLKLLNLIHEDYHEIAKQNIAKEVSLPYEILGIKKDNANIPIELESKSIILNGENVKVVAVRDITERKKAADALIKSERKFRTYIENSPVGIYFTDGKGLFTSINKTTSSMLGYSQKEIVNKSASIIHYKEDYEYLKEKYFSTKVGEKMPTFEIRMIKKSGEDIYVLLDSVKISNEQSINFITDISEIKKIQQEISIKNEELNELNVTKDKFFSIIAHDLRGPIYNVVGFSDLIYNNLEDYTKDKLAFHIKLLNESAHKTSSLLENLLIWSRSQRNIIEFSPKKIYCREIIEEVHDDMKNLMIQKNISFHMNHCKNSVQISVDKNMIKTVFRNLLSNAIKYTHQGGEINIGYKKNEKDITFFVKDNGVGIPKETVEKLFKLDQNVTTEGTNNEKGTGLGLLICKDFIEKHNGKIWVESEQNQGSSFYFTLPL